MIAALIAYAVCAAVLLIWSTLLVRSPRLKPSICARKNNINYVVIPSFLLSEWAVCYLDLVVFDLREDCQTEAQHERFPGSLHVRPDELPHLFRWLPPRSTIVLVKEGSVRPLAPALEHTLAELGIDTVYFLDRRNKFPEPVAWNQIVHTS